MKNVLFGNEVERMLDLIFRFMKVLFKIYYFLRPAKNYLKKFGIKKHNLTNVIPVLSHGSGSDIPDDACDLIFAIDMFHMVKEPYQFLKELCRIIRINGILIIEDGHQPRTATREKILKSGCWKIITEEKRFLRCTHLK